MVQVPEIGALELIRQQLTAPLQPFPDELGEYQQYLPTAFERETGVSLHRRRGADGSVAFLNGEGEAVLSQFLRRFFGEHSVLDSKGLIARAKVLSSSFSAYLAAVNAGSRINIWTRLRDIEDTFLFARRGIERPVGSDEGTEEGWGEFLKEDVPDVDKFESVEWTQQGIDLRRFDTAISIIKTIRANILNIAAFSESELNCLSVLLDFYESTGSKRLMRRLLALIKVENERAVFPPHFEGILSTATGYSAGTRLLDQLLRVLEKPQENERQTDPVEAARVLLTHYPEDEKSEAAELYKRLVNVVVPQPLSVGLWLYVMKALTSLAEGKFEIAGKAVAFIEEYRDALSEAATVDEAVRYVKRERHEKQARRSRTGIRRRRSLADPNAVRRRSLSQGVRRAARMPLARAARRV